MEELVGKDWIVAVTVGRTWELVTKPDEATRLEDEAIVWVLWPLLWP